MTTIRFPFCCNGWIGYSLAFILSSPNGVGTWQFATVRRFAACRPKKMMHLKREDRNAQDTVAYAWVEREIAELLHFSFVYSAILPGFDCGSPNGYSNCAVELAVLPIGK